MARPWPHVVHRRGTSGPACPPAPFYRYRSVRPQVQGCATTHETRPAPDGRGPQAPVAAHRSRVCHCALAIGQCTATGTLVKTQVLEMLVSPYQVSPCYMLQFDHVQRARQALLELAAGAASPRVPLYAVLSVRRARHAAALRKRRSLGLSGARAGRGS